MSLSDDLHDMALERNAAVLRAAAGKSDLNVIAEIREERDVLFAASRKLRDSSANEKLLKQLTDEQARWLGALVELDRIKQVLRAQLDRHENTGDTNYLLDQLEALCTSSE